MISKEDILFKRDQEYFQGAVFGEFAYKAEEVYIAMDEHAKSIAIGFSEYIHDNGIYQSNVIPSTEELFQQYIKTLQP